MFGEPHRPSGWWCLCVSTSICGAMLEFPKEPTKLRTRAAQKTREFRVSRCPKGDGVLHVEGNLPPQVWRRKTASCDSLVCRNSEELYSVFQKLTFSLCFRRVRGNITMKIKKYYLVVEKFRFFEIISSPLLGHSVCHYACAVTIKLLLYNTLTSLWRAARGNLRNGKRNIRKYKNAPISFRTKPNKERAASVCTL